MFLEPGCGDGTSNNGSITIGKGEEILDQICSYGFSLSSGSSEIRYNILEFSKELSNIGLKNNKQVPPIYLRASAKQRLSLLQGLMDIDGGMEGSIAVFTNTNKNLSDAVYELVVSLGMKATKREKISKMYGKECKLTYIISFTPTMEVFRLWRKKEKIRINIEQKERRKHRYIVDIKELHIDVPMRCIAVDSPNHLFLAGKGMIPTHNTHTSAKYVNEFAIDNPGTRIGIIAPTLGDAVTSCVNGESGLKKFNPGLRLHNGAGGLMVYWPNGSEAKLFGAHTLDDVDRLRAGGNRELIWAEEICAWARLEEAWSNMRLGLRIGPRPHLVGSTTPRNIKFFRESILKDPRTIVTYAKTSDNQFLGEDTKTILYDMYSGTRIGKQELEGMVLEDLEGALWKSSWIEANRVRGSIEEKEKLVNSLRRIVIGVDPATTFKVKKEGVERESDETGIAIAGIGEDGHYYVLDVYGIRESPTGWARKIVEEYERWSADKIIAESNNGGDLVERNIRIESKDLPIKLVHAYKGKALRAEPIANLYEQNKVHHLNIFDRAEDQMTVFPVDPAAHDDMVDALVYSLTELSGRGGYGVRFL